MIEYAKFEVELFGLNLKDDSDVKWLTEEMQDNIERFHSGDKEVRLISTSAYGKNSEDFKKMLCKATEAGTTITRYFDNLIINTHSATK